MTRAAAFSRAFSPYRKRYYEHGDGGGLFPDWRPVNAYLTDGRIDDAILGKLVLAFLSTASPKALGLDIDDHGGRGPGYLVSLYDSVCGRFGARPSFLVSSPRGLHAWYFLMSPHPFRFLEGQARERLHGLRGVEIRPTPAAGLRLPEESRILSPDTLLPVYADFSDAVNEALESKAYHAAELFGEGIMPEALRLSLRERRGRFAWGTVSRVETDVYPILPGNTNAALCRLVPVYREAGLSEGDAAARFAALLAPVYGGELRSWGRLYARVKAFYKRPAVYYERPRKPSGDLFSAPIGETVAALWDAETRKGRGVYHVEARRAGIKRLVSGIVDWTGYVSEITRVPAEREAWGYLYPYFTKNRTAGYFPLPKSLLFRLDKHYNRVFPFLRACGFLEAAPYPYVPGAGICRYYRVETMRFS